MERKTTGWIFQTTNKRFPTRDEVLMTKMRSVKRETEFLLIAVQKMPYGPNMSKQKQIR